MSDTAVTVSFVIDVDDVWVDPDEIAWYVKDTGPGLIHLERTVVTTADALEMARNWRRVPK
jgi:hypothetical protein